MGRLDGASLKIEHAEKQYDTLVQSIRREMNPATHRVAGELRPETYRGSPAYTLVVTEVPSLPIEIGVQIGEVVHNLRSAVDHVAWSLVPPSRLRSLRARAKKNVEFPMASNRKNFKSGLAADLPGVNDTDVIAFVEGFQPYHRSPIGRAMRALQTLSNTDKHRTLVPTRFVLMNAEMELHLVGARRTGRFDRMRHGQELKRGTKVTTWTVTNRAVRMEVRRFRFSAMPAFAPNLVRPAPGNTVADVTGTLTAIKACCAEIVSHFSE